ncbi:MAG: threonine--tRNA ligase [Armatimonadetes bacterium]|nr:threonine--tRNA ligase [Armatimonadota bacterium]
MKTDYPETPLYKLRHSCAHLMAQAVLALRPGAKLGIGPPIENGFYYDFDLPKPIGEEDLAQIEAKMAEFAKQDLPIERFELSRDEAKALIEKMGQAPYKIELLDDIPENEAISFYQQGDFADLCRGPHVRSTGELKHFKLLNVAGAYWRGDERNKMLTRLYGTAWESAEELEQYLYRLEEAKKRDHRRLGRELGLFFFSQRVGQGLPLWLPKGAALRQVLHDFLLNEQKQRGYQGVVTPHIGSSRLFEKSGHVYTFREKMFPFMEDEEKETFILKPMNCPFHIEIYQHEPRSYRDLPIRLAEFGTVYRYEQSGELAGMLRVRGFTQDDSHLFVSPDQLQDEFKGVVDLMLVVLKKLGLEEYRVRVGLRDRSSDKYVGSDENWELAQAAIEAACKDLQLDYELSEGDAAFYGPKLDLIIKDALGREWQMGTVQVDYNLPERFELEYTGEDGKPHRPIMIHRAPFGSLERMIGLLTEHYAGAFPFWMAPVQIVVLPIADRHVEYAEQIAEQLGDYRIEVDDRRETLGKKIRSNQQLKIPYMLICGDKDIEASTVSARSHEEGDLGPMSVADFRARLASE